MKTVLHTDSHRPWLKWVCLSALLAIEAYYIVSPALPAFPSRFHVALVYPLFILSTSTILNVLLISVGLMSLIGTWILFRRRWLVVIAVVLSLFACATNFLFRYSNSHYEDQASLGNSVYLLFVSAGDTSGDFIDDYVVYRCDSLVVACHLYDIPCTQTVLQRTKAADPAAILIVDETPEPVSASRNNKLSSR